MNESVSRSLSNDEEGKRQRQLWESVYEAFVDRGVDGVTDEIKQQWQGKEGDLSNLIEEIREAL